uniref:Uncharacterized protein n=1 Tax=Oryza brachyantha TaxID=4533 RepID=J3LGH8_ORYBR
MEMKKIACAVLVAASATVAFAAEAPAPAPTSASPAVAPTLGAALGATVVSFFAYYLQQGETSHYNIDNRQFVHFAIGLCAYTRKVEVKSSEEQTTQAKSYTSS